MSRYRGTLRFNQLLLRKWPTLFTHQHCLLQEHKHDTEVLIYPLSFHAFTPSLMQFSLGNATPHWMALSSVQFSLSVVSDSLRPHGLQHARPPCPSPTPGAYSNSCPLHQWCHPTILSSVVPLSSHLQFFRASGSLPMSWFFASGGQSIGVSASASVLPMNTQDWFPLGWTGWISLQSKGLAGVSSNTTVQSINSSALNFLYSPTLTAIHDYWKNHSFD